MSLHRPQAPPRMFLADEIIMRMETVLNDNRAVYAAVAEIPASAASFQTVIVPLIDADNLARSTRDMIAVLQKVSPDQATRDAAAAAQQRASGEDNIHRQRLYVLIQAVHDRDDVLDGESRKMMKELRKDYKQLCLGAPDREQMQEYTNIMKRINSLRSEFLRNIREECGGLWFSTEELAGVPKHDLDRFGADSLRPQERFVSFSTTDYYAVMKNADSASTRRQMYIANANKLPQNVPLLKEIITLKGQSARLLGYRSHAERLMEYRLARSTEWVYTFLGSLQAGLVPQAKLEMDTLKARKYLNTQSRGDLSECISPWDFDYYAQLVERDSGVDQALIAEYFPLQSTVPAVLNLISRFLDLKFVQVPSKEASGSVWHEDVEVWAVWDTHKIETTGGFLGYLFLDLFHREKKYKGELNVTLQSGFQRPDGTRCYPSTVLLASYARPGTPANCTLLKHHEVKTFIHELGHAIHDLLGVTKYARFSGANTSRDFVEVPSLLLERFSWIKSVLKEISCHYTRLDERYLAKWQGDNPGATPPPEKIPDPLLDGLIKSRTLNRASKMLLGVATSQFDMAIHDIHTSEAVQKLDVGSLWYKLQDELAMYRYPDHGSLGHPYVHFGHLVGTYDAGYYSYSCSQSFADDIFMELFAKDPHSQDAWRKYRRGILQPGGSMDEMEMLEALLGRPSNPASSVESLKML